MKKIIFLTLLSLLTGCARKTECPAFSEDYLNWIPYKANEHLAFTDGKDTYTLSVGETYVSGTYVIKQPIIGEKACTAEASAKLSGDSFLPKIEISGSYVPAIEPREIIYNIILLNTDYSTFIFGFSDGHLNESLLNATMLSSYDNGYKLYSNVIKLDRDTLFDDQQIYQVYIAESEGIIQFKDRKYHKTWNLVSHDR